MYRTSTKDNEKAEPSPSLLGSSMKLPDERGQVLDEIHAAHSKKNRERHDDQHEHTQ